MQDVRRRFQKTVTYQAGAPVAEDLGRGLVLRDLYLRLRGQLTCAAAANTQAALLRGDAWAVVQKIELLANNQQVIRSITGNELWWLNYVMYGTPPMVTPALGDAATLNPAFDVCLALPMWMFRCVRPMDTALDTRLLSDLKLRITWGSHLSINAAATGFTVAPTIDIHSLESALTTGRFNLQTVYSSNRTITANDPKFQMMFPVNDMYRGFLINTTDIGVDVNTILNNVQIKSGTTIFADVPGPLIQGVYNHLLRGAVRTFDGATGALATYDAFQRSAQSSIAGWYWLDLISDGRLTECIDTLGFSEFYLEMDVNVGAGATRLTVIPIQITPVRGQK